MTTYDGALTVDPRSDRSSDPGADRPPDPPGDHPSSTHSNPSGEPPVDLESAAAFIAAGALRAGPVGPVGIELEGHVHHRDDPRRPIRFAPLAALAAELSPLPAGGLVTLEPGGQVEVSSAVHPDAASAVRATRADAGLVTSRLADLGLTWTLRGTDPWRPPRRINPAPRYAGMEAWFDGCGTPGRSTEASPAGSPGRTMMCSTAALQVNLEAGPPEQWAARVNRAARLGPLLTALTGSSRWLAGQDTGRHSARQRAWSTMDPRIGGPLVPGDDPVTDWTARVLDAPVVHLPGPAGLRPADRCRSLRDWLSDPDDWPGATLDDVRRHLTTQFPSVRLRGFLELRCLDALPEPWWPAVVTAVATWMDDPRAHPVLDAALAPVADRWEPAYDLGLADPALQDAAVTALELASTLADPAVPAGAPDPALALGDLLDLARRGTSPGALLAAPTFTLATPPHATPQETR